MIGCQRHTTQTETHTLRDQSHEEVVVNVTETV